MKYIVSIALLFAFVCVLNVEGRRCRALALEGGGSKGAYQAGALKGLVDILPPEEVKWEVVTGVSVGALNLGGVITFPIGQEKAMVKALITLWQTIKQDDIYRSWAGGIIHGIFFKSSFYDNTPLFEFIENFLLGKPLYRKWHVGVTDAQKGVFMTYNETMPREHISDIIQGSTSLPAIFPFKHFMDYYFFDGGCVNNLDVSNAVARCREIANRDDEISVDIILTSSKILEQAHFEKMGAMGALLRFLSILYYQHSMSYVFESKTYYPDVNFRYLIAPSAPLPVGLIPLSFDDEIVAKMIEIGELDAREAVEHGEGNLFNRYASFAKVNRMIDNEISFSDYLRKDHGIKYGEYAKVVAKYFEEVEKRYFEKNETTEELLI